MSNQLNLKYWYQSCRPRLCFCWSTKNVKLGWRLPNNRNVSSWRSPDSDIFWSLLCHRRNKATAILFLTGHGNRKHLIHITRLSHHYTQEMCEAMLGLHSLTGCDSVSLFKDIGKLKPLKLLLKSPTYCDTLRGLGEDGKADYNLIDDCEQLICAVYGKAKFDSVNEMHHLILQSKCDRGISVKSLNQVPWIWRDSH